MSRSAKSDVLSNGGSSSDSGSSSNITSLNSSQSSSQSSSQNSSRANSRNGSLFYMSPLSEYCFENVPSKDRGSNSPSSNDAAGGSLSPSTCHPFISQYSASLNSPQLSSRDSPNLSAPSSRDVSGRDESSEQQDDELAWRWMRNVEEAAARTPSCSLSGVWHPPPVPILLEASDIRGSQDGELTLEDILPSAFDYPDALAEQRVSPIHMQAPIQLRAPSSPQNMQEQQANHVPSQRIHQPAQPTTPVMQRHSQPQQQQQGYTHGQPALQVLPHLANMPTRCCTRP